MALHTHTQALFCFEISTPDREPLDPRLDLSRGTGLCRSNISRGVGSARFGVGGSAVRASAFTPMHFTYCLPTPSLMGPTEPS